MAWKASQPVAPGITYLRTLMVNVFFVAQDQERDSPWVLIDAGLPGHANASRRAAQGHTPGHISLFRPSDSTLIAGDAVVTTHQESLSDVMTQSPHVWRPPAYYTTDWDSAETSVRALDALDPSILATGHGRPMSGPLMREQLHELATRFRDIARPRTGRYTSRSIPASSEPIAGAAWDPARVALGAAVIAGGLLAWTLRRGRRLG